MIPTYAVIPTRGRPHQLMAAISSIAAQVQDIVIVDNNDIQSVFTSDDRFNAWPVTIIHEPMQPPNLSKLWNIGLDVVEDFAEGDEVYNVVILNDDAIAPDGWVRRVSNAMRGHGAAAGSSAPFGLRRDVHVWGADVEPSVATRVTGWAFMLRGELGFRFDEQFQWWCGDDDMSVWARNNGGLVHVGGVPVQNLHANESTDGLLARVAADDMQRFVDKHGRRPW